jgi:hypothetical protein
MNDPGSDSSWGDAFRTPPHPFSFQHATHLAGLLLQGQSRRAGQVPAARRLASWAWRRPVGRGRPPWLDGPRRRPPPPQGNDVWWRRPGAAGLTWCLAALGPGGALEGRGERGLARSGRRPRLLGEAPAPAIVTAGATIPGSVPDNGGYRELRPPAPRLVPARRSQVITGGPTGPGRFSGAGPRNRRERRGPCASSGGGDRAGGRAPEGAVHQRTLIFCLLEKRGGPSAGASSTRR